MHLGYWMSGQSHAMRRILPPSLLCQKPHRIAPATAWPQLEANSGGAVRRYVSYCCPQLEEGIRGMLSLLAGTGLTPGPARQQGTDTTALPSYTENPSAAERNPDLSPGWFSTFSATFFPYSDSFQKG